MKTEISNAVTVRPAREEERYEIAEIIAYGFEKDFSVIDTNMQKIASVLSPGLKLERFLVAERKDNKKIAGVIAISDSKGRCYYLTPEEVCHYCDCFEPEYRDVGIQFYTQEFIDPLHIPDNVGYFENLIVVPEMRRCGLATLLLEESMRQTDYPSFMLDVVDFNDSAYRCYKKFGFSDYKVVYEKEPEKMGYNYKTYMTYTPAR